MKIIYLIVALFITFFSGCEKKVLIQKSSDGKPVSFKLHTIQCPDCHMEVDTLKYSAQIISQNDTTYIFDDVGCMVLFIKKHKLDIKSIWAYTHDTNKYIDATKLHYKLAEETPMEYGFCAYEYKKSDMMDYEQMKLMMYRGENMSNQKIKKIFASKIEHK